jgi:archaemetzincin
MVPDMPLQGRKKPHAPSIALTKMGRMPQTALRVITANIQAMLETSVEMLPAMVIPEEAFQHRRCQYDAGLVLKYLARFSFPQHSRLLAITDVDLCTPIHTFVFGEAQFGLKLAIISDFRLKHMEDGGMASEGTYYERLAKVALHEIAHTFSLYHCETPKCLMRFSQGLGHLDELDIYFCERCSFAIRQSMRNLHV